MAESNQEPMSIEAFRAKKGKLGLINYRLLAKSEDFVGKD